MCVYRESRKKNGNKNDKLNFRGTFYSKLKFLNTFPH